MAKIVNFTGSYALEQGDDHTFYVTITDGDDAAIDITDWLILFTLKNGSDASTNDDNAVLTKDVSSHYDAAGGKSSFIIEDTDCNTLTGPYKYSIKIVKDDGTVKTLQKGNMEFTDNPTKRITVIT